MIQFPISLFLKTDNAHIIEIEIIVNIITLNPPPPNITSMAKIPVKVIVLPENKFLLPLVVVLTFSFFYRS